MSIIFFRFFLGKGDVFGENFSVTTNKPIGKSRASIRALTYCDLHAIGREDALYIIRAYPDFRKSFADLQTSFDLRDPEVRLFLCHKRISSFVYVLRLCTILKTPVLLRIKVNT